MKICIDDLRTVSGVDDDEHYRNAKDGLYRLVQAFLRNETIATLYLDHDLGDGLDINLIVTFIGYACLQASDYGGQCFINEVIVHSMNAPGAKATIDYLAAAGVCVKRGSM